MRKNKMMRLASALLVLTLLTTSVISGTFAKYTTTNSASDTARVAKWGVSITASGNLYSDAYNAKGETNADAPATTYATDKMTVASSSPDINIVAPGTKSTDTGLTFSLDGKPEVAVAICTTITARDIFLGAGTYGVMVPVTVTREVFAEMGNLGNLYEYDSNQKTYTLAGDTFSSDATYYVLQSDVVLTDVYKPVKYTLAGNTTASSTTAEAVAGVIANAVNGGVTVTGTPNSADTSYTYTINYPTNNPTTANANVYAPNTDLATDNGAPKLHDEKLTWEWTFDVDADTDKKDTVLGNMIAECKSDSAALNVVVLEGTSYKDVTYDNTNKVVKNTSGTIIASLKTQFDIELTATQVD